jgi:hypothetical protein
VSPFAFGRSVGRAPPTGTQRRLRAVPIRGLLKRRRSKPSWLPSSTTATATATAITITAGGRVGRFPWFRSCWRAGVGCRTPKSEFGVDVGSIGHGPVVEDKTATGAGSAVVGGVRSWFLACGCGLGFFFAQERPQGRDEAYTMNHYSDNRSVGTYPSQNPLVSVLLEHELFRARIIRLEGSILLYLHTEYIHTSIYNLRESMIF